MLRVTSPVHPEIEELGERPSGASSSSIAPLAQVFWNGFTTVQFGANCV